MIWKLIPLLQLQAGLGMEGLRGELAFCVSVPGSSAPLLGCHSMGCGGEQLGLGGGCIADTLSGEPGFLCCLFSI